MNSADKIFIYGFIFTLMAIMYIIGFAVKDVKNKYLRRKRINRLNRKAIFKIFLGVTGFCLLGSINNKMFSWYEAPIMGFIITSLVMIVAIFRPESDDKDEKPCFFLQNLLHCGN